MKSSILRFISGKAFIAGISLSIILLDFPILNAQSPDTLWTRTFGGTNIDIGHAVRQTQDDGYIVAGYTRSFGTASGRNVWLIKVTPSGSEQWNQTYGGNNDDEANAVQQTSDGGYIIAGYTKSFGMGGSDVFLIKTDSVGTAQWTRTFGGTLDDEAYGVLQTADGGFLVAGATSSFATGGRDAWLIKTNASGDETWSRTLGGLGSDGARSVSATSDSGFILSGWTFSYGPGAVGNAWLVKTDALGYATWNKAFGGTDVDRAMSARQTSDGGYILTGYTSSSGAGLDDMLLVKTDNAGNEQWARTFGGTGRDYGNAVQQTADGGYLVAGYTLSFGSGGDDVWLVRTDSAGVLKWSATYGGTASDVAHSLDRTSDGGYIITGHTLSRGAGVHDVWLLRLGAEVTGVADLPSAGRGFALHQNYPNPFNPSTTINYQLPTINHVTLKVFDVLGREVATLVDDVKNAGQHSVKFHAGNLSSGVYYYRLTSGNFAAAKKLLLIR